MAQYGIHHATASGTKPSIFEIIGQENLLLGLRNAFRHTFKILAENYPERYGLIHQYFDEGYTVVDSVFQYMHLRLKGGLLPETFYGLKRVPDPRCLDVSKQKVAVWVILAVVFPYLQSQMENLYRKLREDQYQGTLNYKDLRRFLALGYLKFYPYYHGMWEFTVLCYYMAFALKKTDFHSPLMHLTSTTLTHLSFADSDMDEWKSFIPKNQLKNLTTTAWSMVNVVISGVTVTISIGAFVSQFLDWWYNREGNTAVLTTMPVPPPPSKWPLDAAVDKCLLCQQVRTNDTALTSSGFVFCYPCIFRYVEEHRCCPITGYKSSLNQLVKLYHQ